MPSPKHKRPRDNHSGGSPKRKESVKGAATKEYARLSQIVAKHFDLHLAYVASTSRDARAVHCRRVIAICLRQTGYSFPEIGEAMDLQHSTVMRLVSGDIARNSKPGSNVAGAIEKAKADAAVIQAIKGEPRAAHKLPHKLPWTRPVRDPWEEEWRDAVEAYARAQDDRKEDVWMAAMMKCFPVSWKKQITMPPRSPT